MSGRHSGSVGGECEREGMKSEKEGKLIYKKNQALTGNNYVGVVLDQVLDDRFWILDDVGVAPVDPLVLGAEGGGQEVVAGLAHGAATGALELKRVARLNVLALLDAKVLSDDGDTVEGAVELGVGLVLQAVELEGELAVGVVGRVGDQEGEVDEAVRVGELGDQLKMLAEVWGGVAQRRQDQHAALVGCLGGAVEVDVVDGAGVDLDGFVVVEQDGGLVVGVPV